MTLSRQKAECGESIFQQQIQFAFFIEKKCQWGVKHGRNVSSHLHEGKILLFDQFVICGPDVHESNDMLPFVIIGDTVILA